jgi:hypothetical protein
MKSRLRRLSAVACAVGIGAMLVLATFANANQYQRGSASVTWTMPGAFFTNWEQDVVVTNWQADTFWNIQWQKIYGPVGYLGIQTPGGTNKFIFSMFSGTAWQTPPGGSCTSVAEGGGAIQCLTPVGTTITNRKIRLMLIKSNRTNFDDRWWSAWANIDGVGGKYLGQIQAPHVGWLQTAFNFHEYFGQGNGWNGSTCVPPGPPKSAGVFGAPTVSSPNLSARKLARSGTALNLCPGTDGQAIPFYDGAFTQLGDR